MSEALDALLKGKEDIVELQTRAANVSSGRAAAQCAVADKSGKRGGGRGRGRRVTFM